MTGGRSCGLLGKAAIRVFVKDCRRGAPDPVCKGFGQPCPPRTIRGRRPWGEPGFCRGIPGKRADIRLLETSQTVR